MTENHPARNRADVLPDVHRLVQTLSIPDGPFSRVVIAGSLRREKVVVHDAEIVAEVAQASLSKTYKKGKLHVELGDHELRAVTTLLENAGVTRAPPMVGKDNRTRERPWGPKYFCGNLPSGLQVDLFLVTPPAAWPVILLIRTGSAEFSQAFVTRLHRYGLKSEDGHIIDSDHREVRVETEDDLFRLAHLEYLIPSHRSMDIPETRAMFYNGGSP